MTWDELVASVQSLADAVRLACEWEARAPKLGNVHPRAPFADCCYEDFVGAASVVAPILGDQGAALGIGTRARQAVLATRTITQANVNLGIILLIAPLAVIQNPSEMELQLQALERDPVQSQQLFDAIRLAAPGGMKQADLAPEHDIETSPTIPLGVVSAMQLAAYRDRIARQYTEAFRDFFLNVVPLVQRSVHASPDLASAIVQAQLQLMAQEVDSLILRKCGLEIATEAQARAAACLNNDSDSARKALDDWLRADGHRRNPGTTADLIAAALFWLLKPTLPNHS